jgi:putative chitinase
MVELTVDVLAKVAPGCRDPAGWIVPLNDAMARFAINSAPRAAAFLAQITEESAELNQLEENLDYRARRLVKVWRKQFPTLAAARPYEHAPEKLANRVYAGRLGNGDEASGDGWRFRGRGLIQITGRDNYRVAAAALASPYEEHPERLVLPPDAALSAAHFWQANGLNELADGDGNFAAITQRINGGQTGDKQRRQFWAQAKDAFDVA